MWCIAMVLLVLVLTMSSWVSGSRGDYDPSYRGCVETCFVETDCSTTMKLKDEEWYRRQFVSRASRLRTFFISLEMIADEYFIPACSEECMHKCAYQTTQENIRLGYRIDKFDGHWVFYRYFNLQEPASSLFSLLNALPHFLEILKPRVYSPNYDFMESWAHYYPYIGVLTWVSSAIYHGKRTDAANKLDLCTALILISYGLIFVFRRLLGPHASKATVTCIVLTMGALLIWRLGAMVSGEIDYHDHMPLAISLVIVSVTLWMVWIFCTKEDSPNDTKKGGKQKRYYPWQILSHGGSRYNKVRMFLFQLGFIGAAMLELFDFPPYFGIFDAHALWHACTVPLGFLFYDFIRLDRLSFGVAKTGAVKTGRSKKVRKTAE